MYSIFAFLMIFSMYISSGHQQVLNLPHNSGEGRHNQDFNHWPLQTIHTVQGNFYGEAQRNVHAKPCPRRRNFENSDGMQGVPTFTSRITKPLVVNDNNNLKPQSLKEDDPNIGSEISRKNQEPLSTHPIQNNYYDFNDFQTRNSLSLNNKNLPSAASLDNYNVGGNEEVSVPELSVNNGFISQNYNDHETPVGTDGVLRSVGNEDTESLEDEEDLKKYNVDVPLSDESDLILRNIENDEDTSESKEILINAQADVTARKLETDISSIEIEGPEILSKSGLVSEDSEPLSEANVNAQSQRNNCQQKNYKMDKLNEPSRRFLSRPDEQVTMANKKKISESPLPVIIVNKKTKEVSPNPEMKSQSSNDNKEIKLYHGSVINEVVKNGSKNKLKEEVNLNKDNNENILRSQINNNDGDQLEPTRGLGISNMGESRVMLMKNTRVCYACSTVDNPTCWTPNRRTTVKYCRKEHNACVTKTYISANSLIMVRDCGNTCNDPGITGLVPKYKSCSICHSDLCNGAYSVNSHNLMLVLFLISLVKCTF